MSYATVVELIASAARIVAAGAFLLSVVVVVTHWAVRNRKIEAFNPWARFVRTWSDPLLRPVERRVVRAGGNPQDAALWLAGGCLVGGLVLIAGVTWVLDFIGSLIYSSNAGGRIVGAMLVHDLFSLLIAALFVRVIGSWVGAGRYSRFMRPFYWLTDWLIDPLQRVIPPFGMIDISPLVAYFMLYLAERVVMQLLF